MNSFEEKLNEWESQAKRDGTNRACKGFESVSEKRIFDLIAVIRKQREALINICRPTKLGEHQDPWFYRQNNAKKSLQECEKMLGD